MGWNLISGCLAMAENTFNGEFLLAFPRVHQFPTWFCIFSMNTILRPVYTSEKNGTARIENGTARINFYV